MKNKTIILIILILGIFAIMESQLKYPLDQRSKELIKEVAKESMNDDIFDSFWNRNFYYLAVPESFDSWAVTGTGTYASQELITGATSGDTATISSALAYHSFLTFQKRQRFVTYISMDAITTSEAKVGIGRIIAGASVSAQFYGFKIVDGAIYGMTDTNGAETTVNLNISVAPNAGADVNVYTLEARYIPNGKILFYVGETKYTTADMIVTSRQPTVERGRIELTAGLYDTEFPENVVDLNYQIKTTTNATRNLRFTMFEFSQER